MISLASLTSVVAPIPRRRQCSGCRWFPSFLRISLPCVANEDSRLRCISRFYAQSCNSSCPKEKVYAVQGTDLSLDEEENDDHDEEFQVVTAIRSNYNDIVIVDTPRSRMLLLDSSHNVHSMYNKEHKWTGFYWDEFASLPAILPQGPVAIFGLGGGTVAHLMLDIWPSLELEGWEIDKILIDMAREYFGLLDIEKHTPAGGILRVCVGDALSPSVTVPGGYAGIVIDLFSDGKVLPQLEEVSTWLDMYDKLMPNGRLMVNCGAANDGAANTTYPDASSIDGTWVQNSTIKALCQAFPGQVNWKKMPKEGGENYLALTGPLPDLTTWSGVLPDRLSLTVKQWKPCLPL
ncbi:Polyamine aminopropyl transferase [Actinidia chinensis var. chinensis]|uniref:Polyamine aminopropyl transferase n=1 Tax=Actinidia chinensis var. chinensis TaxID=1590841 RepID=A0A2R6QMX8_ACTCC|nr:Polyamine aminopropyl transferase [Actinidia chinensis var. chinensis]